MYGLSQPVIVSRILTNSQTLARKTMSYASVVATAAAAAETTNTGNGKFSLYISTVRSQHTKEFVNQMLGFIGEIERVDFVSIKNFDSTTQSVVSTVTKFKRVYVHYKTVNYTSPRVKQFMSDLDANKKVVIDIPTSEKEFWNVRQTYNPIEPTNLNIDQLAHIVEIIDTKVLALEQTKSLPVAPTLTPVVNTKQEEEIQELKTKNQELEDKMEEMEKRMEEMEKRMNITERMEKEYVDLKVRFEYQDDCIKQLYGLTQSLQMNMANAASASVPLTTFIPVTTPTFIPQPMMMMMQQPQQQMMQQPMDMDVDEEGYYEEKEEGELVVNDLEYEQQDLDMTEEELVNDLTETFNQEMADDLEYEQDLDMMEELEDSANAATTIAVANAIATLATVSSN